MTDDATEGVREMSAALNALAPANVVEAELKFIIPNGQRPQMFKPAPGQTEGRRTGDFEVRVLSELT